MLQQIFIKFLLLYFFNCISALKAGIHTTQRKAAYVDGDFIIGTLFPIHHRPTPEAGTDDPLLCGNIRERYGIQRVEAALFAVDAINRNPKLLPNLKLGINIRDDCWSESVALYHSFKLIERPMHEYYAEDVCSKKQNATHNTSAPLLGIIGPSDSSSTIEVQHLLTLFRVPQISYIATSSELLDSTKFPYYASVLPDDSVQAIVMLSLLKKFGWTYVSILYIENDYGESGKTDLTKKADQFNICISKSISLPNTNVESYYENAVRELSKDEKVGVVICLCYGSTAIGILKAVKKFKFTGRYLFLGSDSWGTKKYIVSNYSEEARGSLIVSIDSAVVPGFEEYYYNLKPKTNKRNPWFSEFWEKNFKCKFDTTKTNSSDKICTGNESLKDSIDETSKIPYVIESVYAFANALHNMQVEICGNVSAGVCEKMNKYYNSTNFMKYLLNVSFSYNDNFVTLSRKDSNMRYKIFNYQKLPNGTFDYVQVGMLNMTYENLKSRERNLAEFIYLKAIQFPHGKTDPISSVCAKPCLPGQIQLQTYSETGNSCCWFCTQCNENQYAFNKTHCQTCAKGFWPNANKSDCFKLPEIYVEWTDTQYLICLHLSAIGILLTSFTSIIFVRYRETPIVKSSTRELCYIMLFGMIMAHTVIFAIISPPSKFVCGMIRILPALSFSMIYSPLLVKTNRIARIFAITEKMSANLNPKFLSSGSQIIISAILILVEIVILCCVTLSLDPPLPKKIYNEPHDIRVLCTLNQRCLIYSFSFVGLLLVLCTMYAVKTRKLPENFNEAKFIGFSMYTTCITWIAFVLVYYGSDLQMLTISICSSTNALVILTFLFFPKLYIIMWAPEKNTRVNFTTFKKFQCSISRDDSREWELELSVK